MPFTKKGGLVDPVAGETGKEASDEMEVMDLKKAPTLSFQPIPPETARITRPFDGYPFRKFKVGLFNTYEHCVVALNPTVPVPQDPANRKVKQKDGKMGQVRTCHSRIIRDRETNENIHVPFDRDVEVDGRPYQVAIMESHNVRAQICFFYDPQKQRIVVDPRYLLLDVGQRNKLRDVFQQVINPNIKMEREAAFIAGESKEDAGGADLVPE
ncbi:MAG: hypothetical protein ABIJ57_16330 [Pseudomonadota bacterium]